MLSMTSIPVLVTVLVERLDSYKSIDLTYVQAFCNKNAHDLKTVLKLVSIWHMESFEGR